MRHQPFWNALAAEGLDKQRRRMLQAGLLVLRYLDVYFEEGREAAQSAMNMRSFRRQLLVCGDNAFGRLLTTIVSMVDRAVGNDVVFGGLSSYAYLLEENQEFSLAYDVWDTVICQTGCVGVRDVAVCQDVIGQAYRRRAFMSYLLGRPLDAVEDYARAFEHAERHDLEKAMMGVSIDGCVVQASLGAHSLAIQTLGVQMAKAERNGWDDLYASAAMNRGHVYSWMKSYQDALLDFSLAIHTQAKLRDYDALVMNIAACAAECGYFSLAKDAHELTCVSAVNVAAKTSAVINLIELSMWTNDRADFDKFSALANELPVDAKAQAYRDLYTARGRIFFKIVDEPLEELGRALTSAQALNFGPVIDQINQDLRRFHMGGSLVPAAPKTVPLPLAMRLLHKHLRARLKEAVA